jgi:hypothetical protein
MLLFLPIQEPYLIIHRRGMRRLREICGRAERLPNDMEVVDDFEPTTKVAQCCSGHSDVYKTQNGTHVVALKQIRANQTVSPTIRRVRLHFWCLEADALG